MGRYHGRKPLRTCIAICLGLTALAARAEPPPAAGASTNIPPAFDAQGHRGARGLAPENTLIGFARALELGVDTLELDLGVSADDQLVVLHDLELNAATTRGPDGHWLQPPLAAVHGLTGTALRSFDVGRLDPQSRYASRYPEQQPADGQLIPTLAEVIDLTRQQGAASVRFNIETKLNPMQPALTPAPEAFAALVAAAVRELDIVGRTTVQSFDWRTLLALRNLAPRLRTSCLTAEAGWLDTVERGRPGGSAWLGGLDVDAFGGSVPDVVQAAGCSVWSPWSGNLDSQGLSRAHALGLQVVVWTVNEPDEMARLLDLGADGIITDYPDRLLALLRARGLRPPSG